MEGKEPGGEENDSFKGLGWGGEVVDSEGEKMGGLSVCHQRPGV